MNLIIYAQSLLSCELHRLPLDRPRVELGSVLWASSTVGACELGELWPTFFVGL